LLLGCLVLTVPVALYFGVAWLVGLLPHAEVGTWFYAAGAALAALVAGATTIMGESVIGDWVKLGMMAVAVAGFWFFFDAGIVAIALGAPVGAAMPLLLRAWPKGSSKGEADTEPRK
jgi:chromate transport protein ChrA